jgi:integrase
MAFLWRHPKSKYWFARFTGENGQKINRSTRTEDRKRALEVALGWEHAASLARKGLLTQDRARSVVNELLERLSAGHDSLRLVPAREFFADWLAHKEATKSATTAARYQTTLELFLAHLGERAGKPLAAITPRDIQGFLTARSKDRSSKTVMVDAKSLAAAFHHARRHGLIDRNPVEAVELPRVRSKERTTVSAGQLRLLLDGASADWGTAIFVGYFTGARLSDVVNLCWSDVDLVAGVVSYRQRKTGQRTITPLHPELQRHLEQIAGDSGTYIMPTLAGRDSGGKMGLSQEFARMLEAAGIDRQQSEQKSGRKFSAVSFHSLRHSFESSLAAANVTPEMRRELTGRADAASQRAYTHFEFQTLRSALAKLPTLS